MSVCVLSVRPSVSLSVCLSLCLCLSVMCVCLYVFLSVCVCVCIQACHADKNTFCADARSRHAVRKCMQSNLDSLSEGCSSSITTFENQYHHKKHLNRPPVYVKTSCSDDKKSKIRYDQSTVKQSIVVQDKFLFHLGN